MKEEAAWRIGHAIQGMHRTLLQIRHVLEQSRDVYLDDVSLRQASIRKVDFDLTGKDEFFSCMTAEQLASLSPSKPLGTYVPYEHVEFLASTPPKNVGDREDSAIAIELWFHELREWKLSRDGCGSVWPKSSSAWVPRDKFDEEDLYNSSRKPPSVSYQLFRAYSNYGHPHQVYHAWHGDEGREGIILRSEVQILISCMAGRMSDPALCVHKVPVGPIAAPESLQG